MDDKLARKAVWIMWKALEDSVDFEDYKRRVDKAMREMLGTEKELRMVRRVFLRGRG